MEKVTRFRKSSQKPLSDVYNFFPLYYAYMLCNPIYPTGWQSLYIFIGYDFGSMLMAGAQSRPNIFILADSQADNNALYFHGNLRAGVRSRFSVMGIKEENKRASRGNDRSSPSVDDILLATVKILVLLTRPLLKKRGLTILASRRGFGAPIT